MSYTFPSDVQKLIQQQMATGHYSCEDDLLRDALRALAQQHTVDEPDPIVVEGIRRGLADLEAGRGRPLEEFDAEFRASHNIRSDG